jgi:uncharacterized protein
LRDQLLAAGLVTEKQARQAAQQEQQRQFRNRPRPSDSGPGGQRGGNSGTQSGRNTSQGQSARDGRGMPQGRGGSQGQGSSQGQAATQGQGASATQTASGAHGAAAGAGNGQNSRATAGGLPPQAAASLLAQQAQAAKIARDQELNRRREEKAQRKARLAQIEQIVEQNRLPRLETEDHYSFIDGKKIRRMSVDPQRREQLTRGELAIVRYRGHYAVVPTPIAERIRERDPNMVVPIVQPKANAEPDDADAYKDFVVPDDLMW